MEITSSSWWIEKSILGIIFNPLFLLMKLTDMKWDNDTIIPTPYYAHLDGTPCLEVDDK